MNNQPVKQVVGNVGAIYTTSNSGVPLVTKQGAPFIRIAVSDANNQSHTISIFNAQTQQLIQQRGVGSGPWTFTGTEVTSPQGYVNFNLKSAVLQQQAPGQVEAPPTVREYDVAPHERLQPDGSTVHVAAHTVAPAPQQKPIVVGEPPWSASIWADNLDDRGRSIIRQVAFKDVPNKDDKTPDQIWDLTNIYENILLGRFIPDSSGNVLNLDPPSDGSFVQQEF